MTNDDIIFILVVIVTFALFGSHIANHYPILGCSHNGNDIMKQTQILDPGIRTRVVGYLEEALRILNEPNITEQTRQILQRLQRIKDDITHAVNYHVMFMPNDQGKKDSHSYVLTNIIDLINTKAIKRTSSDFHNSSM